MAIQKNGFITYYAVNYRHRLLPENLLTIGQFGTDTWEVPSSILSGQPQLKKRFLQGFFDGDGSVVTTHHFPVLKMATKSKIGMQGIGQLLTSLGINFKLYAYALSHIVIQEKASVLRYWEVVGVHSRRKSRSFREAFTGYLENAEYQRVTATNRIPLRKMA